MFAIRNALGTLRRLAGRQKTVVLNANAHGFGDAMTTAWISEGSRNSPVRLIHYATGEKADLLRLFGQVVTDDPSGSVTTFDAYRVECEIERGSIPRVESRAIQIGIDPTPQRPRLQKLPRSATEFAADLHHHATEGDHGRRFLVMLCPQTEYRSREWPAGHWIDLAWKLWKAGIGITVQLGRDDERFRNVPRFHFGHCWENKIALMQRCDVVVGIDSAPIHVAGTLGRPTVALLGPTKKGIISHCDSVSVMTAPLDRIDCTGCVFQSPFRAACDQGCLSLARLWPEEVYRKVMLMLGMNVDATKSAKLANRERMQNELQRTH